MIYPSKKNWKKNNPNAIVAQGLEANATTKGWHGSPKCWGIVRGKKDSACNDSIHCGF